MGDCPRLRGNGPLLDHIAVLQGKAVEKGLLEAVAGALAADPVLLLELEGVLAVLVLVGLLDLLDGDRAAVRALALEDGALFV